MTWSVCIFAHNEEHLLPRALGALEAAAHHERLQVHILVNGSTDGTAAIANAFVAVDRRVHVHESMIGDKANAWNDYVHRIAGEADMHVFLDGDIVPCPVSFNALAISLAANPKAYAAAALPGSGRSRRAWSRRLVANRYLSGNLYALSGAGLEAIRKRAIRMPFGAKGEDGLLAYLLLTDLKAGRDDSHRERIAVSAGAFFEFDSLGLNARDLATYRKRLKRYSERHFQKQILYRRLKEGGVAAMPENIYDIYTEDATARLAPRRDLVNFWVDRAVLKQLKTGKMRRAFAWS